MGWEWEGRHYKERNPDAKGTIVREKSGLRIIPLASALCWNWGKWGNCRRGSRKVMWGQYSKLQYFGHLIQRADSVKDPDVGKDRRQEEKGTTKDEIVEWHHWLNGHEFEQVLVDGEGQRSLVCCSSWGHKESDMTERLKETTNLSVFSAMNTYMYIIYV